MDPELKQRLVGAVVITALAAIFVPMLFDEPIDRTEKIDDTEFPDLPDGLTNTRKLKTPQSPQQVINNQGDRPATSSGTSSDGAPAFDRWYIQAGIFSEHGNANALRDKLRKQGFSAFVENVVKDQAILYKVKVGPEIDRTRADETKAKIDKLNGLKSFIAAD